MTVERLGHFYLDVTFVASFEEAVASGVAEGDGRVRLELHTWIGSEA